MHSQRNVFKSSINLCHVNTGTDVGLNFTEKISHCLPSWSSWTIIPIADTHFHVQSADNSSEFNHTNSHYLSTFTALTPEYCPVIISQTYWASVYCTLSWFCASGFCPVLPAPWSPDSVPNFGFFCLLFNYSVHLQLNVCEVFMISNGVTVNVAMAGSEYSYCINI